MQELDTNETCCSQCSSGKRDCACCSFVKTISTAKHYSIYDLEGYWNGSIAGSSWATDGDPPQPYCTTPDGLPQPSDCRTERFNYDAKPSLQELSESYLPMWRAAAPLVGAVMCSYNAVGGIPSCLHKHMQTDVLRDKLNFTGFIVSDCTALCNAAGLNNFLTKFQGHYYPDRRMDVNETCRLALEAGTDANCGQLFKSSLNAAVASGAVPHALVETSLARILSAMFRLGVMDPRTSRFQEISLEEVDSEAHRELARRAAQQSIVLLKNEGGLLPLKPGPGKEKLHVAMIGGHANSTQSLLSNYHGTSLLVNSHSVLQAAQRRADLEVTYAVGARICDVPYPLSPTGWKNTSERYWGFPNAMCPREASDRSGFAEAVAAAKAAEVAVLFLGSDQSVEGEGFDRGAGPRPDVPRNATDDNGGIGLAGVQSELAQAVLAANPRTVLVLIRGGAIDHSWEANNIPAVLDVAYPGSLGGEAILDILMGDVAPTAKLPVTVYFKNITESRDIRDASFRGSSTSGSSGVTHRFFDGPVLWRFGSGLHYTTFSYSQVSTLLDRPQIFSTAEIASGKAIEHQLRVHNTGDVASGCVILAFVSSEDVADMPRQLLIDFERLATIEPDEARDVVLRSTHRGLAVADEAGKLVLRPGMYTVKVGDIEVPVVFRVELIGEPVVIEDLGLRLDVEKTTAAALKLDDDTSHDDAALVLDTSRPDLEVTNSLDPRC
jgi:hypothetical protein